MGKEQYFKKGVTPKEMAELRHAFRQLPEMSHEDRARTVQRQFPQFKPRTLEDFSRCCLRATEMVFQLYLDGKFSTESMLEITLWEGKDQEFMAQEYIEKKMGPSDLRKVKRIKKEQACGFAEAIAKALGEMPLHAPREQKPRSFDTLLDDIQKSSSRWRALTSMAFDLIGAEEAKAGVHAGLFQQAYILRHVIKENYDFANQRVNRYFNYIKKKYRAAAETSSAGSFEEGDTTNGDAAGTGEEGLGGEEGAAHEDGQALQDQPE